MKVAIVVFPGSNCDRDISWAIQNICGKKPDYLWHKEKFFTNYVLPETKKTNDSLNNNFH